MTKVIVSLSADPSKLEELDSNTYFVPKKTNVFTVDPDSFMDFIEGNTSDSDIEDFEKESKMPKGWLKNAKYFVAPKGQEVVYVFDVKPTLVKSRYSDGINIDGLILENTKPGFIAVAEDLS